MNINLKLILFIIFFGTIIFISDTSFSQNKKNIDVVIVMDSSGSMKKTDPQSLRIPAAKLFISLLDEKDSAGVISFSDNAYPLSYLTPVNSEENKKKLFKATDNITSDGLYTNLYNALSKGHEILSRDKKTQRAQILILMSDGMMDVGDPDEDRRLVDGLKNELAEKMKDNNVKVYTIAFTEQSDKQLLKKISKQTGGFFNLALSDKDFHLIFTSIFESLKTPEMLPMSKNGFLIDKSVEEVTIVVTKGSPDTKIQLDAPDGQNYSYKNTLSDIKWFVSNKFDMITVKNPVEGRWEILFSTGENNKAYVITNLKLQTNFSQLYSAFGEPFDMEVWLEKDGNPIREQEVLEKIDMYIELSSPAGKTIKLKPFKKGEGIFFRRIAPYTPGNYKLKVVAEGKTFEREKAFVFNVATAKESQEELEAKRSAKKMDELAVKKPIEDKKPDEISWGTVIIKFLLINLTLGTIFLVYLKRKKLKDVKLIFLKNKGLHKKDEQDEQTEKEEQGEIVEEGEQTEEEEPIEEAQAEVDEFQKTPKIDLEQPEKAVKEIVKNEEVEKEVEQEQQEESVEETQAKVDELMDIQKIDLDIPEKEIEEEVKNEGTTSDQG